MRSLKSEEGLDESNQSFAFWWLRNRMKFWELWKRNRTTFTKNPSELHSLRNHRFTLFEQFCCFEVFEERWKCFRLLQSLRILWDDFASKLSTEVFQTKMIFDEKWFWVPYCLCSCLMSVSKNKTNWWDTGEEMCWIHLNRQQDAQKQLTNHTSGQLTMDAHRHMKFSISFCGTVGNR